MAQERELRSITARETDPNVLQSRASNPESSVWVGASAGTGKTKVLTDRVLRLLLPAADGQSGTLPHKILCLTFTKAGAGEMALRLSKTLSRWASMPEGEDEHKKTLRGELKALLGRPARPHEIAAARKLFAAVVDHPGGLPIMTIHAFCQSLLGRFPLEAGLAPGAEVLEDAPAARLLEAARTNALEKARATPGSPEAAALHRIGQAVNEDQFRQLLADIKSERGQFLELMRVHFGPEGYYTALCAQLGLTPGADPAHILRDGLLDNALDRPALLSAARILGQGKGSKDANRASTLAAILQMQAPARAGKFEDYRALFLTKEGKTLYHLFPAALSREFPEAAEAFAAEATRLEGLLDHIARAESALLSRDLFLLANAVLTEYEALKTARGALDFDDLILRTLALLNGSQYPDLRETMPGWVNYKLDQGLDHLLVDEAQDTNPEQWKILEALTREFFGGDGSRAPDAAPRTVFVVGDDKQSIYSFQRASPQEFGRMKAFFDEKHKTVGRKLDDVQLNISFRSAESVLKAVDAAFADMGVEHSWHRRGQAGLVELWPLTQTAKREKTDFWELPLHEVSDETAPSGPAQMASRIAATIGHWLNAGEILPSRGRAIRPGDIMILLKNRKKGEPIVAALKAAGIPVAGADRMVLNEELAVQDLLAACGFALLPEDDLTLACLLKSPLIGMDEEALFTLAYGRRASLWAAIPPGNLKDYLQTLIGAARAQGPYAFLSTLLNRPCPASARSGLAAMQARLGLHALEPIEALLEAALEFERSSPASLQLFVDWQSRQAREIKREMEAAGDEGDEGFVRIMTVHGSKGLQAPIVFLPDTVRTAKSSPNQSARRLLWPHQSGNTLPLWSPRKDTDSSLFEQGMDHLESLEDAEYRRLFYVAMTRAEDRLYIAGAAGTKNPIEESWYNYARAGFARLLESGQAEELEDGTLRLANPQNGAPDKQGKDAAARPAPPPLPAWALTPPAAEPSPARPLAPSRPSLAEPAARSPLQSAKNDAFIRGNLTHKLLQFLPALPPANREGAGKTYLARYGAMFESPIQTAILTQVMAILTHPDFAPLFGPHSLAEAPISGFTPDGRLISGQIDRLLIGEKGILIADYKTGRNPPDTPASIPPAYRAQMQAYADLIRALYPGRAVKCALIWTEGAVLMPLSLDGTA